MSERSFFGCDRPIITSMVQADTPERVKELCAKSAEMGADAVGMQFEQLKPEFKTNAVYKDLFASSKGMPVYATNYRCAQNNGKSDETLAKELIELAECGAALCDVMGDCFDRQPDELTMSESAVNKQMKLIEDIHSVGAKVLMSSHVLKFTPAERVLEIAFEQKKRGADISKIVTGAENTEQQLENLKIVNMLKEELGIPFLFLSGGECDILRRLGGKLGCCMYLCVCEHDKFATPQQPLIKDIKTLNEMGL